MNTAESDTLRRMLDEKNWQASDSAGDAVLIIINTCSVRETAEQRVFGRLAHYAALKKKRRFYLLVTGCMAARLGNILLEKGADFVLPPESKDKFDSIINTLNMPQFFTADKTVCERRITHDSVVNGGVVRRNFRALLPIMQGCDNFCSYCIVPYVRGRERSCSPSEILNELTALAAAGVCEVTLLGQNVNSYRYTENGSSVMFPELLELVARLSVNAGIRRVRFLSSHPKDFTPEIIETLSRNLVFCRHIHLCVQHGSNRMLELMNRRYTRETYFDLIYAIRKMMPGVTFSTDILVGFPGETEEDFEQILSLMEEVRFLYAYMYHYNPREGTAAYNLSGRISESIKRARLAKVIELQKHHTKEYLLSRLGSEEEVLVEGISRKNKSELLGRTEKDEMAVISGDSSLIGSFIKVRLLELRGNTLWGEYLNKI
jgi:tRNA-2-methylthio-N6-dimethylallyladenosine synthase